MGKPIHLMLDDSEYVDGIFRYEAWRPACGSDDDSESFKGTPDRAKATCRKCRKTTQHVTEKDGK